MAVFPVCVGAERADVARAAAAKVEAFLTFLDPTVLVAGLRAVGFAVIDNLGSEHVKARYFAGRADGLRAPVGGRRLLGARV